MLRSVPDPKSCHPDWLGTIAEVLQPELQSWATRGGPKVINMWLDCAGFATEMHAADILQAGLRECGLSISFSLFCGCDKCPKAAQSVKHMFSPKHWSSDIKKRDFNKSTFECDICGKDCEIPKGSIEFYSASFPCSPWSMRGSRKGFSHPTEGDIVWDVIDTIKHMQPYLFMMENVVEIMSERNEGVDFKVIMEVMQRKLQGYCFTMVKGYCPTMLGYPNARRRWFCLGSRVNNKVSDLVPRLLAQPPVPMHNFRVFLGIAGTAVAKDRLPKFNRLFQMGSAEERARLAAQGCTCSLDPYKNCMVHACKCGICRPGDTQPKCKWRELHRNLITEKFGDDFLKEPNDQKLTYIQCLELEGIPGPASQRERNLLNLLTSLPDASPIADSLQVLDKGQGISRTGPVKNNREKRRLRIAPCRTSTYPS